MTKRAGLRFIIAMGLMSYTTAALAGAWTLDQGTGELIVTGTFMQSTEAFSTGSTLQPIPRYSKDETQALIEYGITSWFTAIVAPSLQHVEIGEPYDALRGGLGYTDIGGRARIWSDDTWVVSAQATVRIPGTYDNTNLAAIGYTDPEIDLRGLVGHSFNVGTMASFVDVEVAQRFRLEGPPDEFRADVTFGI
jgi:protein XagA